MKYRNVLALVAMALAAALMASAIDFPVDHLQGEIAGEVTHESVILQTRLTAPAVSVDGDVAGRRGVVRFEIDDDSAFAHPTRTDWLEASPARDYVVKKKINGLKPDVVYYYRIEYGPDRESAKPGPKRKFRTLPGAERSRKYRLAVTT